ncbi:hypothetical protein Tco_0801556 [Tanacetum coccineum]|uniref:Uncharacterized protein n=1 Tax=Tanacetum coccineum TaxID=301880 RepID=A0ABQ4ZWE0_9ASTR
MIITLVSTQNVNEEMMFDVSDLAGEEVFVAEQGVPDSKKGDVVSIAGVAQVSTAATTVTITPEEITLAQALQELRTAKPKVKGIIFKELVKSITTTTTISSQQPSKATVQDKGKGKMVESEPVKKFLKKYQIKLDEELAFKLQAEEEEEEKLATSRGTREVDYCREGYTAGVAQVSTAATTIIITPEEITLAQALQELRTAKPKVKRIIFKEPVETTTTTTTTISSQQLSQATIQDKGKGKMVESEPVKNFSKKDQIRLDEKLAFKLQAEEEEEKLIREKAQQVEEANIAWDDIETKIETDYELAQRLQAEEQEELTIVEKATLFQQLLEKRRKHFVAKRAEEKRNRPPTRAQQRSIMCTYLKNMNGWKPKDLKSKSFADIPKLFDKAMKKNAKKQKVDDDQEAAKMKELMKIVPDEEKVAIDAIPLATKPPIIVGWKIIKEGKIGYFQIIRADGSSKRPEEGYERLLWGDLKTMFEPNVEDEVWKMQQVYKGINKARDTVMSDYKDSTVTYIAMSSPFRRFSDIGSPRVDGPPVMPEDPYVYVLAAFQAPPSPDYVSDPEYPPLPDFVPEPVYPEFMPPKDEILPAKEQPLPIAASLAADSPGYVPGSNLEEDPVEDDDKDPEEDPADYPADRGDDGSDEDESSDDDKDDDDVDIEEDKEEEEHLAPVDSTVVAFPADIHPTSDTLSLPSDTKVTRLLAIPTPPPSPLSLWSSPLPQIPSLPLPSILSPLPVLSPLLVSPPPPLAPPPLPVSPTYPLGYRAAMIRLRAEAPSTSHLPPPHIILSHTRADTPPLGTPPSRIPPLLPIPIPTSSLSLHLLSTDRRADRPEVTLPPRKRLCIALGPRYKVGESSSALLLDLLEVLGQTMDEMLVDMSGAPTTDDTDLGRRMTEFATRARQDTDEIYVRLDDEQTERQLMAGRLNMLYKDRHAHARTALLMERESWMRQVAIIELPVADRRRQAQFIEALKLLKALQTQMTAFQRQ